MFGPESVFGEAPSLKVSVAELAKQVLNAWPAGRLVSYAEVADTLGEIPWDVQEACRHLVNHGALVEGRGAQRGMFARVSR